MGGNTLWMVSCLGLLLLNSPFKILGECREVQAIPDAVVDTQKMLDYHNMYRKAHGSPALTWSPSLAKDAASWAAECRWAHSPSSIRPDQGENLYASSGYPEESAYSSAAISWYNEIELYSFDDPGDFGNHTFKDIGHFTAMVWRDTKEVGCARAMCNGGTEYSPFGPGSDEDWVYVVCRYSPPGNMLAPGPDKFKFFKQQVQKPSGNVTIEPPRSCSGKTKIVKFKVSSYGTKCDNGTPEAAIKAAENIGKGKFFICSWGYSCQQRGAQESYVSAKLIIPQPDVKTFIKTMNSALKNGSFYNMWNLEQGSSSQPGISKGPRPFKVCMHGQKDC